MQTDDTCRNGESSGGEETETSTDDSSSIERHPRDLLENSDSDLESDVDITVDRRLCIQYHHVKSPHRHHRSWIPIGTFGGFSSRKIARSTKSVRRLNTQLMRAITFGDVEAVQGLLNANANPNTTCHTRYFSACHIAALHDNEIVSILINHGADFSKPDDAGRTPLHIAAWSGNLKPLFALLKFPAELQKKLKSVGLTAETENDIKKFADSDSANLKVMLAESCHGTCDQKTKIPKLCTDYIDHNCEQYFLPRFHPGWTPLHAAASSIRFQCCRVLLAAGADPNLKDQFGLTPLHRAGTDIQEQQPHGSTHNETTFTDVVKLLSYEQNCWHAKPTPRPESRGLRLMPRNTSLHVAAELETVKVIALLLESGLSPNIMNGFGLTPLHICVEKRNKEVLEEFLSNLSRKELRCTNYGPRCKDGYTVLHYAVRMNWLEGVSTCFEVKPRASKEPAYNGDTPLHTAASVGNIDILKEVLRYTISKNAKNGEGETAIFKAIKNNQAECVKILLQDGASIKVTSSRHNNVFHVSAEQGRIDILKVLLEHDEVFTRKNVNVLTTGHARHTGFGPIHLALNYNHIECFNLLLSKYASISLKTDHCSTLLHIAASKNNLEIAKFILKTQPSQIHDVDKLNWTPLHTASCSRAREVSRLLVLEGADLLARTTGPKENTAIEMIMNNISKPTEFFESIFDTCIRKRPVENARGELILQDFDIEVVVDYSILLPKSETPNPYIKLNVIEALLKTGDSHGQKRLLIHPLVESFICLKWKALVPFVYAMVLIYCLFALTLTIFVMTDFGYKDSNIEKPFFWNTSFWTYALYSTIVIILVQEVIFLTVNLKHYVLQIETWVKLASITLAMMLPTLIEKNQSSSPDSVDWARHVATSAILTCWLYMIFLLSRFPKWGCYVLMFHKVFSNVVKILLTFTCLLFGFTLSFMIQFHHLKYFKNFWTALVKTMVMLTSEFDYDDLVDNKDTPQIKYFTMIRVIFLIFLIVVAIVLMNLMVGVSVNDINNLEVLGRIMQLQKHVEIINNICSSLETIVFKKVFIKLFPKNWLTYPDKLIFNPYEPKQSGEKAIPPHVRDAIFMKATAQEKNGDQQVRFESVIKQLDEIRELINSEHIKKQLDEIRELINPEHLKKQVEETHRQQIGFETQMKQVNDLNAMSVNADVDGGPRSSGDQKELVININTS